MRTITFLRYCNTESLDQSSAVPRRHDGVLCIEVTSPTERDVIEVERSGLLLISGDVGVTALAYVVEPSAIRHAAIEPSAIEPSAIEPSAISPSAIEHAAIEHAAIEPSDSDGVDLLDSEPSDSDGVDLLDVEEIELSGVDSTDAEYSDSYGAESSEGGGLPLVRGDVSYVKGGIQGWRITILFGGRPSDLSAVVDAVVSTRAAFTRVSPPLVRDVASLKALTSTGTSISTLVETVEDALVAVDDGATDLLLEGWSEERVGELRDALGGVVLTERTAFPLGVPYASVVDSLEPSGLSLYLNQIDGCGRARPQGGWAPGLAQDVPRSHTRLSNAWGDKAWVEREGAGVDQATPRISRILRAALDGVAPSRDEVEILFSAHGDDVEAVADVADTLRKEIVGDDVTFVVNRNINYTNQCFYKCGFCAFSKGPRSLDLRGAPYLMTIGEIVERSQEAWESGASEVCLQGGIHPGFTGRFYLDVVEAVKRQLPDIHIHGFTPLEIFQGAASSGRSISGFLTELRDAGLGSLPGTAAEILDDEVREWLCPDKINTKEWSEVMIAAHEVGLKSTATIMFGHIDGPGSWANHIEVVREIQRRTGGFTEFVPLPFIHMGSPIWLDGGSRPGPTWDEVILMHAVARVALIGLVDNIQASWVKVGLEGAEVLLRSGCNDVGGTLMDESISAAAGASHGTEVTASDFRDIISDLDRNPVRRSTTYEAIETGLTIF